MAVAGGVQPVHAENVTVTRRQTASGAYDQAASGSSTTLVATWPSATLSGSLLVAVVGFSLVPNGSSTWAPPAGWSQMGRIDNATNCGTAIYAITGAAARSGAETFRITSASRDATLTLIEYTSTATLILSTAGAGTTGSSTAPATNAVAPDTSGSLVRVAGIVNRNTDTQSAPTNSFVQVAQQQSGNATAGNKVNTGSYERIHTSSTGLACAVTLSGSRPWSALQVVWRETAATETRPKRWNGSAWVSATGAPKAWTGSAWA